MLNLIKSIISKSKKYYFYKKFLYLFNNDDFNKAYDFLKYVIDILVVCNAYIRGYKCFNFIRASAVVNCQSTVVPA